MTSVAPHRTYHPDFCGKSGCEDPVTGDIVHRQAAPPSTVPTAADPEHPVTFALVQCDERGHDDEQVIHDAECEVSICGGTNVLSAEELEEMGREAFMQAARIRAGHTARVLRGPGASASPAQAC